MEGVGILQPTRSFGDVDLKLSTPVRLNRKSLRELKRSGSPAPSATSRNNAISSIPSVSVWELSDIHTHLVCASDGLFDKLSNDEVASLVCSAATEEDPAVRLCNLARERGVRDDITCVVMSLVK